jgi:ring-1,2-phenylacetyl-CoA epoxidase subunit PaaE
MSLHFHTLSIAEVRKETADCVSILFDVPETLKKTFAFTQGQNITVRCKVGREDVRRSYSLCVSPSDNELRIAVKKIDDGFFSVIANDLLKAGDALDVMPPTGKFNTPLDTKQKKNYTAFAAGSGITPVISIIKTTLETEPNSHFTLVYGNKNSNSIIFKEALQSLKDIFMERFQLIHVLSRERTDAVINEGRIDAEKLQQLSKIIDWKTVDDYFICGPEAMIFCVKNFLTVAGIPEKNIHFELFATSIKQTNTSKKIAKEDSAAKSHVTIRLDGRSFSFTMPYSGESLLDAALQQGADLPYACKGGMCCTCKAKLIEGKVSMDVNYGLEEEEVKQGYILTCQAHPLTETISVDYDIK